MKLICMHKTDTLYLQDQSFRERYHKNADQRLQDQSFRERYHKNADQRWFVTIKDKKGTFNGLLRANIERLYK